MKYHETDDHCKTVLAWHKLESKVTHCGQICKCRAQSIVYGDALCGADVQLGSLQAGTVMHRLCC